MSSNKQSIALREEVDVVCPECKKVCTLTASPDEKEWIQDECWNCGAGLPPIRLRVNY